MSHALPTVFSATQIRAIRLIKRVLWPHPHLYYPVGLARKRGNVLNRNWEAYMGGYPRSANTFTQMAFLTANPGAKILTHRHIPTFVISMLRKGIPGMVLIRKPLDAAISVAIYENGPLERAVAYWNDYYETLLPYRSELFLVQFEDATRDFGAVMRGFNTRWGTSYVPFEHTPENAARCFRLTEDLCMTYKGGIKETEVCRPSKVRRVIKENHLKGMKPSAFLCSELQRSSEIYHSLLHSTAEACGRQSCRLALKTLEDNALRTGSPEPV